MIKKIVPNLSLIILLLAFMTPHVNSTLPALYIEPIELTVSAPGKTFQVNVTIADVQMMKGCAIKLYYNTTLLDAVRVYATPITEDATDWVPVDENLVFHWDAWPTINDTYTEELGQVWIGAWGFPSYTGSGAVYTIEFTAKERGTGTLDLDDTEVLDYIGDQIEHNVIDSSVTVIPEFPEFLIAPLTLVATLTAVLLGWIWLRKRKDTLELSSI